MTFRHEPEQHTTAVKFLQYQLDSDGDTFEVLERYEVKSLVGKGAYGKVCSALDRQTQRVRCLMSCTPGSFQ